MNEEWKLIDGFKNYEVSNLGNVRSLSQKRKLKDGSIKVISGKLLTKQTGWNNKYLCVGLYDDNKKYHRLPIHRLVAKTFIPNPNNYQVVNHIDENKFNNSVENLEWVTLEQNNAYSYKKHPERKNTVQILQYDLAGNFIKLWNSLKEASEYLGIKINSISECLRGKSKTSGGFIWKYYYDKEYPLTIEGYTINSKYKKIIQYSIFGNFIKVWDSMKSIEQDLGIKIHNINDCCKQITKTSGNFIWRFYENNFPHKIETEFKKILQYDFNGNLINTFNSAYEAACSINKPKNQGSITGCCKGSRKTAYGYIWKYDN